MTRHKRATLPARNLRLAEQIQKDLAALIQREIDVARAGLITLSRVELSVNYAHARVYFTVLGAEPEVAASALNDKAGWLHSQLYRMLHIHTVPTLRFFHDPQLERAIEMSRLIDEVKRSDAARHGSVAPAATDPAQTQAAEAEPAEPAAPDDSRAPL